jgi:hypothetical protein
MAIDVSTKEKCEALGQKWDEKAGTLSLWIKRKKNKKQGTNQSEYNMKQQKPQIIKILRS